jgi:serine/threonine protein kinase
MKARDPIERLLESVADDTPADWRDDLSLSPGQAAQLETLKELRQIADFHRGLQRGPNGGNGGAQREWGGLLPLERIGSGPNSEVWRAWDPTLRREVALKFIGAGALTSKAAEAAVLDEARAAARVTHPHVVVVHGVARHDDRVGMWMEFVRGQSLDRIVRQSGPLAPSEVIALGTDLASALDAVHAAGVLHRDVKPANVVRDASGRWVLVDFGLGLGLDPRESPVHPSSGTPMYMAPEVFRGEAPTASSDLYSLGLLLWFALTGQDAFSSRSVAERAWRAVEGTVPNVRDTRADVPAPLATALERSIAPDPARRFASGAAFATALRESVAPSRAPVSHRGSVIALIGMALVLVASALLWQNSERARRAQTTTPATTPAPATTSDTYAVEATFLKRTNDGIERLQNGARVAPGDRLSLEVHVTRQAWVYVLNEDERGERYLLFPQPSFDAANPLPADSLLLLPGTIGGRENAWNVTSRGGREHFLVVVSPHPVDDLEAELARLPAPRAGRPIAYAPVPSQAMETLRGVGGLAPVPAGESATPRTASAFDHFRSLAERETGMSGVWVRQLVLENPVR